MLNEAVQISQKMRAQSPTASGAANMSPRAKLPERGARPRAPRDFTGADDSFAITALSIMAIDLLLLAEKCQRALLPSRTFFSNPLRAVRFLRNAESSARRSILHVWREMEDILFILRLLIEPKPKCRRSLHRAITDRSRKRRARQPALVLRIAAFILLCLIAPRLAIAQPEEVVTPVEMFDADAGEGVRLSSSYIFYPRAVIDLTYDSNVYNVDAPETEDAYVSFQPGFALKSDFGRHAVGLEARGEIRRYFDISDENSEQYDIVATTLLELGEGIDVDTYVGFARGIERRGTLGDVFFTDEPVAYHEKRAGLDITRDGGRLVLGAGAAILKRDYSDTLVGGVPTDLSIRDVKVANAKLRADLGLDRRTGLFAEVGVNQIDYELPTVTPRDSDGLSALVGVRHEVTSLLEVEAGVGYIHQNFDDPATPSANEFNYRLAASWTPRPQWRLTAAAARLVDASRSQESPAIITSDFRLGAQRALGDRILVGAEAAYTEENYRGSPRKDERFTVAASTTYRLAERIGITAKAGYRDQDGGAFGRSYNGFTASIGVRAAW
ncbi:hypothetical protein SAMN06297468_0487 [Altererythrobacter xiamenensis]|uniref:Beta-barrel porin 2 n=2 Tax=Altererythrobacter xiamenensis TaxID=1316679 RepID=A0A1Y6EK49_9SPHN|nr:hypothetical protein SAMN06297468_0487 [Altererythrobacter xiamenensis]